MLSLTDYSITLARLCFYAHTPGSPQEERMTSRTLHLGLASVGAFLLLVCAAGKTLASSREVVQGAGLTMAVNASTEALDCDSDSDSSTACFDITTDGANITHVFVYSACVSSPSNYTITVDGEPVPKLYTDDGPCESIPRDVWFPLQGTQDMAHVCISVEGAGPKGLQVGAKAGNECIARTLQ
jgi:hypothetical protein